MAYLVKENMNVNISEQDDHDDVENSEITVELDDGSVILPKKLLCEHSEYFKAMCSHNFKESLLGRVRLQGINKDAFHDLIHFYNHSVLDFHTKDVFLILEISVRLQSTAVIERCEAHLKNIINEDNCLKVFESCAKYNLVNLYDVALKLSLLHFKSISKSNLFLDLEFDMIVLYLSNDYLNIDSELEVFEAIELWVNFASNRSVYLSTLLLCLRFCDLSVEDFDYILSFSNISKHEFILKALVSIKDVKSSEIDDTKHYHLLNSIFETLIVPEFPIELKFKPRNKIIGPAFVGNELQLSSCAESPQLYCQIDCVPPRLITYNVNQKKFEKHIPLTNIFKDNTSEAYGYSIVTIDRYLYVIGGEHNLGHNQWNLNVWRYDSLYSEWTLETRLPSPRRHQSVCVIDNDIYLIGGFGKYRIILDTVDKYSCKSKAWESCAKLPKPGFSLPCTNFDDKILLVSTNICLYSPHLNEWSVKEIQISHSSFHQPIIYLEDIYLIENSGMNIWKLNIGSDKIEKFSVLEKTCDLVFIIDNNLYALTEQIDEVTGCTNIAVTSVNIDYPGVTKTDVITDTEFTISKKCRSSFKYLNISTKL